MTQNSRIIIFDAETFGLSPANKNFNIVKVGTPTSAKLVITFTTSFGYALKEAFFNGVKLPRKSESSLEAEVRSILNNGENKLVVSFDALQVFGVPLGQTTISAYIEYVGASIAEIPSIKQGTNDLVTTIREHAPTVVALAFAAAAIFVSVGYISKKAPSYNQLKGDIGEITKSVKSELSKAVSMVSKK